MKGRIAKFVLLLLTVGCLSGYSSPLPVTLVLDPPGGAIPGTPGQTVGWGFTITNNTTYYLLFDNSYFCEPGQDPTYTTCAPTLGTYNDYIATNSTEVAPMSAITETFGANGTSGFGGYSIYPSAALGAMDSGTLLATYMEYDGDPLTGANPVSGDINLSASASVTVITTPAVPEPASWTLLPAGLICVALVQRRARRRSV